MLWLSGLGLRLIKRGLIYIHSWEIAYQAREWGLAGNIRISIWVGKCGLLEIGTLKTPYLKMSIFHVVIFPFPLSALAGMRLGLILTDNSRSTLYMIWIYKISLPSIFHKCCNKFRIFNAFSKTVKSEVSVELFGSLSTSQF